MSLTNGFAKIIEEFVANWVLHDIQHKIDINRYGNVKGVATSHYMVSLMHFLHSGADLSNNMRIAFDFIDHTLLINKFLQLGVRESIIPWICNFISNRQQCVRYNQSLSDFKTSNGGIPQGTTLGPLGFQCFINDTASDAIVRV